MKKLVFLFVVFMVFAGNVMAVDLNIRESYQPKETIIGEVSQDVLQAIQPGQLRLRRGFVDVASDIQVRKLGDKQYIWLTSPSGENNYTILIEDVVASVSGVPTVIDFEKNFSVVGEDIDYSINPGVVLASDDFSIIITLNEDFSKSINVDFPNAREITLDPGSNIVDFSIAGVLGTQLLTINVGQYAVPAFVLGDDFICGDGSISGPEICDGSSVPFSTTPSTSSLTH